MKKNKINLTKLFKLGTLFFCISLLFFNCENEDSSSNSVLQKTISLEKVKEIFKREFDNQAFSNLKKDPLWEEVKRLTFNGKEYLEIPFRKVSHKDLAQSTAMSDDRIVAFFSPDEKLTVNIVHYFAQDIQRKIPDFEYLSLFTIDKFNGFITLYDLKKNVVSVDRYIDGIKSDKSYQVQKKAKNDDAIYYRMPTDCEIHTETIVTETCWFWYYHNSGRTEIIGCDYDYNTYSYQTCSGNGAGGLGSSGETKITENIVVDLDEFLSQDTWDTQNPYDDWNRLTDCEKIFFTSNPSKIQDAIRNRKKAEAAAFNRFSHCTDANGNVNLHNNIGDAYRHAYFSALNTKSMGYSNASSIGDAHECDTPINQLSEKVMDLHNNSFGYTYSLTHINLTESEFYQAFMNANINGKIKTLALCN